MGPFLEAILSFPAVVYTALLGAVVLYWAAVLVSGVDLDSQGDASHVELDGGELDGHDHGDLGDHDHGALGTAHEVFDLLGTVSLRRVPLTVRVSLVVIFGWLVSVLGWLALAPLLGPAASSWPLGAGLTLLSAVAGVRLAGWSARPLVPVFTPKHAPSQGDLAGRDAEVTTGRVDRAFGQVLVRDGGAGLLVDARYDGPTPLSKGARVVVTHWDDELKCVHVEPLDPPRAGVRVSAVTDARERDVDGPASGEAPAARREKRSR
ncbi:MAG: hypothetical protein R3A48_06360 [Polyangiales bacterium]